jgi:hypothetical protein
VVFILVAILLTTLGLVPTTLRFSGPSRPWAVAALLTFSISAIFGSIRRTINIYLQTWFAVEAIDLTHPTPEAFSRFGRALGEWFTILAFVAIALYGMAMLQRPESTPVGWLFLGGGALGLVVHWVGVGIPAFIFLGTGALGVVTLLGGTLSHLSTQ